MSEALDTLNPPAVETEAGVAVLMGYHDKLDLLEREMVKFPWVVMPVTHRFTPGLYIREIFMPAGTILTSKIHKTEHPFVISAGRLEVLTENDGWVPMQAPFTGITKPGTRRVLKIFEDTIWTTFHPTDETDVEKIEAAIIERHDDHLGLTEGEMRALKELQFCSNPPAIEEVKS